MKSLFLLLAIFLAIGPVVSGHSPRLFPEQAAHCWMHGRCRLVCRDDEENVLRCPNRKRCCVLSRYLTMKPVTIDGIHPWTTPPPTATVE
ncbi:beta-defensin 36-like isoform X2 [Saccopteryx leptura]|uniref:beta-defensin 36-like isoform X2 n=1 Tax=Saccopteryx leptura TaxID=249018 RepID=UPI00339C7D0C